MKPNPVILITSTLAMLVAVSQASAVPLYSQPWDGKGVAYASQNDTSGGGLGNFATAYDNFTLGSSATIGRGNFTGVYILGSGTINGFTVQFYADNAGQPGGSLYSAAIAGSGNEAFIGPGTACCFAYSYSLPVNFAANGGIEYYGFGPRVVAETGQRTRIS
jgi:hypothetical protein